MRLQDRTLTTAPGREIGRRPGPTTRHPRSRSRVAFSVAADRGQSDLAPLPSLTASALKIPLLTGISKHIEMTTDPSSIAHLCECLLDVGVLKSQDWNGDIAMSLRQGLDRWVHEECGAKHLSFLHHLIFSCTENLILWSRQFIPVEEDPFLHCIQENIPGIDITRPFGAMTLNVNPQIGASHAMVGEGVLRMESASAKSGFMTLALINNALGLTVGAGTLPWVYEKWMEEYWEDPDDPEAPSFGKWESIVPQAAYNYGYGPKLKGDISTALRSALQRKSLPLGMRSAVMQASRLFENLASIPSNFDHSYFNASIQDGPMWTYLPLLIRWNEHCDSDYVFDAYQEGLHNTDSDMVTGIAFMRVWQDHLPLEHPCSLPSAVAAMRQAFSILADADSLLNFLTNGCSRIHQRVRV